MNWDKRALRALEIPQLKLNRRDAIARAKGVSHLLRCSLEMQGEILVIAFYDRESCKNGFTLPTAVTFLTKDDFISLVSEKGKRVWRQRQIMDILGIYYRDNAVVAMTDKDEELIRSFIPKAESVGPRDKDTIGGRIGRFQSVIEGKRRSETAVLRYKRVLEKINAAPSLPEDYDDWIRKDALKKHAYVFYKRYAGKKAVAYCAICGKEMYIDENPPFHKEVGACPLCDHPVTFRAVGRSDKTLDKIYTALMQETQNNEYVLRFFKVERHYSKDPGAIPDDKGIVVTMACELTTTEVARVYFNSEGDVTDQYKYKYGVWYKTRTCVIGDNMQWTFIHYYNEILHYWHEPVYLYPRNMRVMLEKLGLSYKLAEKLCRGPSEITVPILQQVKYPFAESLSAMGMKTLHEDITRYGKRFKYSKQWGKLHECLGVPKSFIGIAQKHKLDVKDFDLAAHYAVEMSEEDYFWLATYQPDKELLDFYMQFCSLTDARLFLSQKFIQAERYRHYGGAKGQMTMWRDYLQMCLRQGFDMADRKVLFPYNLKFAHEIVMRMSNIQPDPKWDTRIAGCYEKLYKTYYFEQDGFFITPPRDYIEFAREGSQLLHCVCVNGYYVNHVKGTNLIFFVRSTKEPGNPLYTIEYLPRSGKIEQFYGFDHAKPTSEAVQFISAWQAHIAKGTKKEQVRLAA